MILAHSIVTAPSAHPTRTALVLHGILGSARNWLSFMKKLAERTPDWRFVLVDLRHHGDSHGLPGPDTLAACAADLVELCESLGLAPDAVIGHSFGGKVALVYARDHGAGLSQCWVLDSVPGAVASVSDEPGTVHEMAGILDDLRGVALPIASRPALVAHLRALGHGEMFTGWMTTNLRSVDGGFTWRFALPGIESLLDSYFEADLWPFVQAPPEGLTVHLVRGARSDRWPAAALARAEAAAASGRLVLHTLPDAGHWLHVDNPGALTDLLARGLAEHLEV